MFEIYNVPVDFGYYYDDYNIKHIIFDNWRVITEAYDSISD